MTHPELNFGVLPSIPFFPSPIIPIPKIPVLIEGEGSKDGLGINCESPRKITYGVPDVLDLIPDLEGCSSIFLERFECPSNLDLDDAGGFYVDGEFQDANPACVGGSHLKWSNVPVWIGEVKAHSSTFDWIMVLILDDYKKCLGAVEGHHRCSDKSANGYFCYRLWDDIVIIIGS